jgi:peptide/nickel transport system substrate-binding protein
MMKESVLRAGVASGVAALLPRVAIGQSATARVLRFVPQANLTVLDPIVTTAAVTANHAWIV